MVERLGYGRGRVGAHGRHTDRCAAVLLSDRAQPGEHGEDAVVVVVAVGEAELGEDLPDVALHRALGDDEVAGDSPVEVALSDQAEDDASGPARGGRRPAVTLGLRRSLR